MLGDSSFRQEGGEKSSGDREDDSGFGSFPCPKHGCPSRPTGEMGSWVGPKQISISCQPAGLPEGGSWEPPTYVWRLSRLHWGVPTQEPRHTVEPVFPRAQLSLFHPGLALQLCRCTPPLFLQAQEVKVRLRGLV